MTRCQRCNRTLTAPPIQHGGLLLGPVCAVRLGYSPPARENAGKVARRVRVMVSQPDDATPDLFGWIPAIAEAMG